MGYLGDGLARRRLTAETGDETVKIGTSKMPEDEKKAFAYIDDHIDEHVENLQKWIQQPSISNSGEGIAE